jgi:hypothetical protein
MPKPELVTILEGLVNGYVRLKFKTGEEFLGQLNYVGPVAGKRGEWFIIVDNGRSQVFDTSKIDDAQKTDPPRGYATP